MNIAIFSDCYLPIKNGVVTSVLQLKEGLEKKGHNVLIITIEVPNYDETDQNIYRLPSIYSGLGEQRLGIINQGAVNRFLKKKKIELVHTHTEFALGYCGKTVAKKLNIPHIHTTHTLWEEYRHYIFNGKLLSRKMVRRIISMFLKNVSMIIAPSIKAKKYNEELFPEIPVEIVNNGIDVTKFKAKEVTDEDINTLKKKYEIEPTDKLLIFVGRIGKEKRVGELLDSVIPIIEKDKKIKIIFVGDGPALKDLKTRVKEFDLIKNVIFTGFVSWDTVHILYSMSNVFVTLSLSEVHPMTLIEASMCGLPLVVRKDDSCLDLVEHDVNGYLNETDAEFTKNLDRLIHDDYLLKKFSYASFEISKRFTAENHVNQIENIYKKVLEEFNKK
ncbi:MAG TPA: glycosyltransferase [Spirochaetota bacterium]|nr:glycosyltransferase [Spirochaetota bacterium]